MGFLSWWAEGNKEAPSSSSSPEAKPPQKSDSTVKGHAEVPGMNGAVEVLRTPPLMPADVTVFEFGSVSASTDKVTLAGYCPITDDLDPCRWEILPADCEEAPQFRIVF
ncbi:uncharacterized protein LOC124912473 [Impatiens glandulifera]|uniref:uncharacterized protein LOC124912473 n=1 Tax=Impatiens glandulifera TaxID=253017 RepID=UPI001FB09FF4|nr:uncharacterized protein LOC124912473 [Impatiens glandulifera]